MEIMRIAICDDEQDVLDEVTGLLRHYAHLKKRTLSIDTYRSGVELMSVLQGTPYDVMVLDVRMPGLSGIEASRELRSSNHYTKLIFLSNYVEYAVDSYSVDAYYYLLKPIDQEVFYGLLDRLYDSLIQESSRQLMIQYRNQVYQLPLEQLEYCECIGKQLLYHRMDGSVITAYDTMQHVETALHSEIRFLKPHRSYLINMDYISEVSGLGILLRSGAIIPVPKGKLKILRKTYLDYVMEKYPTP